MHTIMHMVRWRENGLRKCSNSFGQDKTRELHDFWNDTVNIEFDTQCVIVIYALPRFGIRSMPVVDVIIQATWHQDWSQLCATTVKPRHERHPSNISLFALEPLNLLYIHPAGQPQHTRVSEGGWTMLIPVKIYHPAHLKTACLTWGRKVLKLLHAPASQA